MSTTRALCAAASMSLAGVVSAQTPTPTTPEEVVITAKLEEQIPEQLAQYGTRVSTIERDDVRKGSYADIAQSLQALAPGLYVQPKNGPFDYAYMSLLGSRTGDILWLVDGVRVNNRLYNGTAPLDTLGSSMVHHLEVLEGGQALFYGTDAVAGAVNIVTQPFTEKASSLVSLATDTHGGRHLDGYYSNSFGDHHLVVYGSTDKTDGFRAFRDEDYQPSSTSRDRSYDVQTYGAKYGYDFSSNLRLSASYQWTEADLDYALPFRVARDVNSREERIASAKLDYSIGDHVGLYLKGYYHWWHTSYDTTYNDLGTPGAFNVLYDDAFWGYDDRGINALARFSFTKGVDYFLGYDLQRYGGRDEVLFIAPNKEQTQAVFAQVRTTPELIPNAHLAAGVRYNSPDVGQSSTVWNLSGKYDLSSNLFVRATLGTNFRLPSAEELFADDPLDERGNPNLKPERSRSLNLSLGGTYGEANQIFSWEVVGFAREIKDLIDYDQFDEVTEQYVFNNVPGTVKVRGGELLLRGSFANALTAELNFTRNSSKVDGGDQINRVPEQLLKASFDYEPTGLPLGATVTLNYTGHAWSSVGEDRVQYGNYAFVDVSGRYYFDAARRHRFVVSLQNAFDREYGLPARGCADVSTDGPYDCSSPYQFVNLGLPRTLRASYTYAF